MKEYLWFVVCYWYNFCWDGVDVFGVGIFGCFWLKSGNVMERVK